MVNRNAYSVLEAADVLHGAAIGTNTVFAENADHLCAWLDERVSDEAWLPARTLRHAKYDNLVYALAREAVNIYRAWRRENA